MNLTEMTQVALLGTERQAPSVPSGDFPLERLYRQLDPVQREQVLLSMAALQSVHEQVGRLPLRDNGSVPIPCADERMKRVGSKAGSLLLRLLGGEKAELLPQWLELATRANQIAPPESLPSMLEMGAGTPAWREAILPVLGERGNWLAQQNPDWNWVTATVGENENIWHTGEERARWSFLKSLRSKDASRARELLASTWKEETPDNRSAFLSVLEVGLSSSDEPFLEAALNDKRKDVRSAAAALLCSLPESALVKRMTERVKPLLSFTTGEAGSLLKLKKAKKPSLDVTLPTECDKAMQRDGVEQKPPQGFGEKAWWLIQMLAVVPLSLWTDQWKVAPAEILTASFSGDWKKEFFEAWTCAAIRQRNSVWVEALFSQDFKSMGLDKRQALLGVLPVPDQEEHVVACLSETDISTHEICCLLSALGNHEWSEELSRAVLKWIRRVCAESKNEYDLRGQLKNVASHLSPKTLSEASTGRNPEMPNWDFWSKGVDEFLSTIQFRQDMIQAFRE